MPFAGTLVGAAAVFMLGKINTAVERMMCAIAAGVMVAASVWSLIMPALEMSSAMGTLAFVPVLSGIAAGFFVMLACGRLLMKTERSRDSMRFFAVTLHNFPEGMAVGMLFAVYLAEGDSGLPAEALAFSLAIALQNIPEGAIISMPDYALSGRKGKAFILGVLSGVVEPFGAMLTLVAAEAAGRILPILFGFAAGAMLFAVADGLLREYEKRPFIVPVCFGIGFSVMMVMDVALG